MEKNKKLRGEEIDIHLKKILNEMLNDGFALSPISRSVILKKLGLKSRSTLLLNNRAELIDNARIAQLKHIGLDSTGKRKRKNLQEQLDYYKEKLEESEKEKEVLILKMAAIIYNLNAKGLDIEEIMIPLRI
ncbi:hypothetical protein [Chryseobacterium lathyri]|uniref:Uncharacterized protein (UPF0335 family) n=1 Tax=Chryseobacterium lathyri TaxID=395933 RepID=A0ABT9SKF1_9FLAO|nr:hypothetical protein [Chryseobacterium lathyri]MDP9959773.1 uncharacterized protein (UPF0335 family) [Chryseobacterium lathyri]